MFYIWGVVYKIIIFNYKPYLLEFKSIKYFNYYKFKYITHYYTICRSERWEHCVRPIITSISCVGSYAWSMQGRGRPV